MSVSIHLATDYRLVQSAPLNSLSM